MKKPDPENELIELATLIRGYQTQRRWSDAALVKAFRKLGSTKPYRKILNKDLSEMNVPKQLINYQGVWEAIKALVGDQDPDEELFDEIYATAALNEAFLDVMEVTGLNRLIILEGPTSSGKSAARRVLMRNHNGVKNRLILVEATVAWGDRPMAFLKAALQALGKTEIPQSCDERYDLLVTILRESRRGLIIEEGEHMGPKCLNMLKTLINQTPGEFIVPTIDTLWRRLETASYEECRQLTSNRLFKRIILGDVRTEDACTILARRLDLSSEDAAWAANMIIPHSKANGRHAFLRGVCEKAATKLQEDGTPVTRADIEAAIHTELVTRNPRFQSMAR